MIDLRQDSPENVKNELLLSSLLSRLSQSNTHTQADNVSKSTINQAI